MAAKWKKLIGKTPDYVGKIKDNLEGHHFATKEVFSHGFPHHPTSLSYDVLQSLVAVGNDMGTIRIFGKAGLEVCLQHDPSVPIKQLIFITNKGYLVSVTNNDTLNLWSLRQRPAGVMHQLQLKKEKVTKCSYTYGSHWLYVGTDKSNVLLVRVEGLALSAYNIPWNEVAEMQGGRRNRPGAVVDMLEHPLDQGKVLLGYTSGLMVLWNLATKQVERRYSHTELLTSLCWMSSGKEFAASFYGGAIGVWSVKSNKGPEKMILPHDTSKGGTPQKKPIIGDLFSPIEKLEWLNVEGNPLFIFTGGTPYECLTPNITLMQGKSLSMLSCDSVIVDFITIPSSPHLTAAQHPKSLLVLCEDGLVVFDISEHGCPHYNVPFVLDLHKPAVTSLEYLDECPDNLTSSLCSVQSKQLVMDNVFKPWPFKGGKWGKGDMELLPADVLITGHCDGSVKFWHANSVSFQQSISVNTLESFERTPVHKMSPSTHKQVVSNEGSSQPEPSSPTSKTGTQTGNETVEGSKDNSKTNEATNKETTSTETPSKESTCSQSSDVKTDESTTPKSKTLPANKQATPVKRSQDGKSETMAHTSSSKSNEKKEGQPKTPDKGKASEGQAKTSTTKETSSQQDDKTTSTAGQSIGDNTSSTKPKTETHSTGDKNTSSDPSTQDPSQPVVTSPTDPDDFVIVDLVDGPVEIPVSEFFPVCHVTLNHDDWSLCVANTGLCVLLYSFHPIMTGSVPIKNLLVKLESPHPPETFSPPGSPDVHHLHGDDIPDSPNPNCGWKVLPETPSTSEGAGFYLVFCCQCVPIDKDQPHPVITCVEYSSKYGILVIGLTSGLVIVDTVNCKCLLVEVDEVELMVDVQANRRSWTSWKAPSSFAKSKKTVRTRSEKQLTQKPSTTNTTVATGSTSTDQGHSQNISTHVGVVTEEEDSTQLCVNTVRIVELNTDKSHMTTGTIWVGTNTGNVIAMGIQVKPATKDHPRTIELCPNGIAHKIHHPTISMSFLDDVGGILTVPSQHYVCESSVSATGPPDVTDDDTEATTTASDVKVTQYGVLCSEVLCKVYTFPDNNKLTMAELVDKTKTSVVKTKTCHIKGCPSLICITFNAEILVYSLPALRPVGVVPFTPLNDLRVLRTFHVATNGSSAIYMYSPSEVQRLSVLKHNDVDFANILPELYMEVADPDLPASKGVLSTFFGSTHHSVLDREELFGENAGHPLRTVAETRAGPLAVQKEAVSTTSILADARKALSERGDKLNDVVETTARMRDSADAFEEATKALKEKYANRKWWQL